MTTCTRCNQVINEIVTIDGKPYGTTCAETVLGIKQFPSWFKGGDWYKAKAENDIIDENNKNSYSEQLAIAEEKWDLGCKIWIAEGETRRAGNSNFENSFLKSIAQQLGIGYFEPKLTPTAESYFKMHHGSNGVINVKGKSLVDLSEKQQSLLEKILSKY